MNIIIKLALYGLLLLFARISLASDLVKLTTHNWMFTINPNTLEVNATNKKNNETLQITR